MPTLINSILDPIRLFGFKTTAVTALYRYRKAWIEAKWGDPRGPRKGLDLVHAYRRALADKPPISPTRWTQPGKVRDVQPHARGAIINTAHARIEITFFAADLVRVRVIPNHNPPSPPIPYAIARPLDEWPMPAVVAFHTDDAIFLRTPAMTVAVTRADARIIIADRDGNLLRADVDVAWGQAAPDQPYVTRHRTTLAPNAQLFGLGERATPGNRRGRTHILWNTDPAGYQVDDEPIDLNVPVYLSVQEAGYKKLVSCILPPVSFLTFYENSYYAEFDLGDTTPNIAAHRFRGGELRYYIATGPVPALVTRYTDLTGRHSLPPLWTLGYQQCRWSYYPEARVRKLARDFKDHAVPCDAIYLDIDYMDGFRCFTWDKERFPDLPQLVSDLRAQGIKIITIIDPAIKKDPHYAVYNSGLTDDHFCTTPDGDVFHAPVWPGTSAFPDFTNPATREWWGALYKPLVDAGIAGFWNDMNEPAAFASPHPSTLPNPIRHNLEGRGGDHAEAHNLYGMQMARASAEGLRKLRPHTRPIIITRAGWAGVQRHATSWTGDNQSTWQSLRLTVPMTLGLGLSGIGITGPDIGGFGGAADGELYTRWIQMAAFMPLFRAHTVKGTPDQEPWSYGEPYLSIVRRFIQLRYELLPYLYTAIWQTCERGWPLVRPLWWGDAPAPADAQDAFLCGDAFLVAPIGEPGADTRSVTLPAGAWYNYWTNQCTSAKAAKSTDVFAPLELIPLFVRGGSIIPMGEFAPSVEQRVQKFLRLSIYPLVQPGQSSSELYEDAGEGFSYQNGDYRHSRLVMTQDETTMTLTWKKTGDYAPPYEHIELTFNGLIRAPRAVVADGHSYPVLVTDPVRRTALMAVPPFDILEVTL